MSLYSAMYSGIAGLSAQSRSLGVISSNIANVNTVGYKADRTLFSSLVTGDWRGTSVGASGVRANPSQLVQQQGLLQASASSTDLAIDGDGFFVVNTQALNGRPAGEPLFTRAGAFTLDADKNLVNTAGYYLTGWKLDFDGRYVNGAGQPIVPDPTSVSDLQIVNLAGIDYTAQATANIGLTANLPANAKVGDVYNSSVQVYDAVGIAHQAGFQWLKIDDVGLTGRLDPAMPPVAVTQRVTDSAGNGHDLLLTFTSTGPDSWSATVSSPDGAVTGGPLTLAFDPVTGSLTSPAANEITVDWTDGGTKDSTITLNLSGLSQAAGAGSSVAATLNPGGAATWKLTINAGNAGEVGDGESTYVTFNPDGTLAGPATHSFAVDWNDAATMAGDSLITVAFGRPGEPHGLTSFGDQFVIGPAEQDGAAYGAFSGVRVDPDGTVHALFDNGRSRAVYKVPLARFSNANALAERSGNAYQQTQASGGFFLNAPGVGGAGALSSYALEASTVDLATEFTNMITTQRAYSANATIITTADEMLEELTRIKR